MERRLSKKIVAHTHKFKLDIEQWLVENNIDIVDNTTGEDCQDKFKVFMGNYADITFSKEDFLKRKRVKNMAPQQDRCMAKRADGTQCTRRKKMDECYCGTHIKGTPHGQVSLSEDQAATTKKIDVWTEDINGINSFIDAEGNVYKAEDVMHNKPNPSIVGRWEMNDGKYIIINMVS